MTPTQNIKLKTYFLPVFTFMFFALAGKAEAAIFVDNAASGCSNGATTYNPANRTCSGGNNKVYTSLNNANTGVSAGVSGSPTVINIRSGVTYKEQVTVTKDWTTWQKYDETKPIIDGEYVRPWQYKGLFFLDGRTGVVFDGIHFTRTKVVYSNTGVPITPRYVSGDAVRFEGSSYCTVKNCDFYSIGDSAVIMMYGNSYITVQNNYIWEAGLCGLVGESTWGQTIALNGHRNEAGQGTHHSTVSGNILVGSGNEAICSYGGAHDNIIEYNTIIDCKRIALYITDSYNETVRYNLLYHTQSNPRYMANNGWGAYGLGVSSEIGVEAHHYPVANYGHRIYGNMVSGYSTNMQISKLPSSVTGSTQNANIYDVKAYNNTFVNAERTGQPPYCLYIPITDGTTPLGTGVEFKNNIFVQETGTISSVASGATFTQNLWSKIPDSGARSATDPGYPTYTELTVANYLIGGWAGVGIGQMTGKEFALRPTAQYAINKGANLGAPYNQLLNLSTSNFKTNTFNLIDQNSQGAWEIGAGVYVGGDSIAPASPSGLSVR